MVDYLYVAKRFIKFSLHFSSFSMKGEGWGGGASAPRKVSENRSYFIQPVFVTNLARLAPRAEVYYKVRRVHIAESDRS